MAENEFGSDRWFKMESLLVSRMSAHYDTVTADHLSGSDNALLSAGSSCPVKPSEFFYSLHMVPGISSVIDFKLCCRSAVKKGSTIKKKNITSKL